MKIREPIQITGFDIEAPVRTIYLEKKRPQSEKY